MSTARSGFWVRFSRTGVVGLIWLGILAACGTPTTDAPLFDSLHSPRVLTESLEVGLPTSQETNRLVRGWFDTSSQGFPKLTPLGVARVQGVHLGQRVRHIILRAHISPAEGGSLDVRIAAQPWRRIQLSSRMRLPIPSDLEPGRFTMDLKLPEGNELTLRSVRFSKAWPAGNARFNDRDLTQSGYSIVEVVRKLESPTRLSGTFRPPSTALPGQRFALELESTTGRRRVLTWEQGKNPAKEESFELELGEKEDFVRVRFVAAGEGPPGHWKDLSIRSRSVLEPRPVAVPRAPKLVILYIMDALRTDHLGHLGGAAKISPTIDRLAAEGTTFLNHLSVAPNTVPSMKSLLTGQKFLLKGRLKLNRESGPTLAERFGAAGFRAGLFSGNGNVSSWRGIARGYSFRSSKVLFTQERGAAGYNNNAEVIHGATIEWLDSLAETDRAFVHIQTIHPHNPYDPPEPFRSQFVPDNESRIDGATRTLKGIRSGRIEVDRQDQERLMGLYAAGVAYNDAHLADFMKAVLERYDREEVLLIVTSDHGEELFEHGGVLHGYTLYDEMLRIPLVVWWPGTVAKSTVQALTDNVDLHATLAAMAGSEDVSTGGGTPLWPYLVGKRGPGHTGKDVVFAAASAVKGGIFMARSEHFKVVLAPRQGSRGAGRWGMGYGRGRGIDAEYVFDLEADPEEMVNLAGDNLLEADWLQQRLEAWIEAGTRLEVGEELGAMDEETRDSLRALGYLQ